MTSQISQISNLADMIYIDPYTLSNRLQQHLVMDSLAGRLFRLG